MNAMSQMKRFYVDYLLMWSQWRSIINEDYDKNEKTHQCRITKIT